MADKSIVTQTQLGDLKAALAQEADSLVYHSGSSHSQTHGFGIIMQGPNPDIYGNDLSSYQDSAGNVVGTHLLLFTLSGVNYYAPIKTTALSGQAALAGITPDTSALLQPGANAWVTDYAVESAADAALVQSALMLPHTRQAVWETHGSIVARTQNTLDSAGHIVGTHILEIFFNQKKIWIPCAIRLGGPPQLPRIPTVAVSTSETQDLNHTSMGRDDEQYGNFWQKAATGGTLPITFTWQVNQKTDGSGVWNDLTGTTGTLPNDQGGTYWIIGNRLKIEVKSGSDHSRLFVTLRGKFSNIAGAVYSNLCHFRANDEDGCGFISGPDTNQDVYNENIPQCITLNHCKPA